MMLYYNYVLTIVGIVSSLLPFLVAIIYGGKLEKSEKEVSESNEKFLHFTKDTLSGFSVLKSFKAENRIMHLFKKENEKLEETKKVRSHKKEKLEAWSSILSCFSQMIVFIFGAYLAISRKGITAGTIMMFVQLMNYVTTPLILIPQLLATRRSALPLVDKIGKLLAEDETKECDKEKVELNKNITLCDLKGTLEAFLKKMFKNFHFIFFKAYPKYFLKYIFSCIISLYFTKVEMLNLPSVP